MVEIIRISYLDGENLYKNHAYSSNSIDKFCDNLDFSKSYVVSFETKRTQREIDKIVSEIKKRGVEVNSISTVSSVLEVKQKDKGLPYSDPFAD
jgi:hypothetical protein